jgi:threo-3-hydroxy-L-aspartate ammonia-lyase
MDPLYAGVLSAVERLAGIAHHTPVLTSRSLDEVTGNTVFLKCENFQRMGAFKFRGAYNAISRLAPEAAARGVITFSSGNHAQAVALAGRLLGIKTTVVMPADAPAVKLAATLRYGANVVTYDRGTSDREALTNQLIDEHGYTLVPPFNHPDVIAGQGTAARELIDEVFSLDALLVPCGGGGLLSGCAVYTRHALPACRIIGVEPETADDATRSFKSGTLQTVRNPQTIADGLRTESLGSITFPTIQKNVDDMVTVSDRDIIETMYYLWTRMKIVVEPSGATALAPLFKRKLPLEGKRIGVILSGGNVDVRQAGEFFATIED